MSISDTGCPIGEKFYEGGTTANPFVLSNYATTSTTPITLTNNKINFDLNLNSVVSNSTLANGGFDASGITYCKISTSLDDSYTIRYSFPTFTGAYFEIWYDGSWVCKINNIVVGSGTNSAWAQGSLNNTPVEVLCVAEDVGGGSSSITISFGNGITETGSFTANSLRTASTIPFTITGKGGSEVGRIDEVNIVGQGLPNDCQGIITPPMNTVCIGDLSKMSGETVLDFDGLTDYTSTTLDYSYSGQSSCSGTFTVFPKEPPTGIGRIFRIGDTITIGYNVITGALGVYLCDNSVSWLGDWNLWNYPSSEGVRIDVGFVVSGNTITITMNGTIHTTSIAGFVSFRGSNSLEVGADSSLTHRFKGYIEDFILYKNSDYTSMLVSYIQNGDFGSATLIDHSGNGNDGTINGATWGKLVNNKLVEHHATKELYKSAWTIPMAESQNVFFTDPADYVKASDSYWNDYNIDPVFTFNVNLISSGIYNGVYGLNLNLNLSL